MDRFRMSLTPWRKLLTLLLLVTQGVVVATPLIEGRSGIGSGAHVEAPTDARHYAHAEADCAYCTVSSMHAMHSPIARPIVASSIARAVLPLQASWAPRLGVQRPNSTRAPPR